MSSPAAGLDRTRPRRRLRTAVGIGLLIGFAVLTWFYISDWTVRPFWHPFDLHVYRGAMVWWRTGHPLYDFRLGHTVYGYTYPPFAAMIMVPMAWVSMGTATAITATLCVLALVLTTWWLVVPIARRHGWSPWWSVAIAVPFVVAMDPVRETIGYLQVNLFLAVFVLADVIALRRGRRWAGVGIGLATAIKLTPGLFVVYLVLTRRWRAAVTATGTFLVVTLVAHLYDPRTSATFWTSALWQTNRVGRPDYTENQSLLGPFARLAYPGQPDRIPWAVLVVVVLVVGLWRAVVAFRRGDELVGITLTGLTGNLVSPISWTHHLYWVVPAVLVLIDVAAGTPLHPSSPPALLARPLTVARGAAVAAALAALPFLLSLPWFWKHIDHPHIHAHGPLPFLGENSYVLVVLLLVLVLPVRALGRGGEISEAAPAAARTTAPPRPAESSPL